MTYAERLEERGKIRNQVETIDNLLQEGMEWPIIERPVSVRPSSRN